MCKSLAFPSATSLQMWKPEFYHLLGFVTGLDMLHVLGVLNFVSFVQGGSDWSFLCMYSSSTMILAGRKNVFQALGSGTWCTRYPELHILLFWNLIVTASWIYQLHDHTMLLDAFACVQKMVNGGVVKHWACINFSRYVTADTAHQFCNELAQMCQTSGMVLAHWDHIDSSWVLRTCNMSVLGSLYDLQLELHITPIPEILAGLWYRYLRWIQFSQFRVLDQSSVIMQSHTSVNRQRGRLETKVSICS